MKKKLMAVALATIIAVMAVAGASLAWLKDTTDPVINTFTEGKVYIKLFEHDYLPDTNTLDMTKEVEANADYKMVPGDVLPKDPTVTVLAESEACWLFVKIVETANVETFLEYGIADGWTPHTEEGVYYRKVEYSTADQSFKILANDKVTVNENVTMEMMEANSYNPTITFTAYAIQSASIADVATAWNEVKPSQN